MLAQTRRDMHAEARTQRNLTTPTITIAECAQMFVMEMLQNMLCPQNSTARTRIRRCARAQNSTRFAVI